MNLFTNLYNLISIFLSILRYCTCIHINIYYHIYSNRVSYIHTSYKFVHEHISVCLSLTRFMVKSKLKLELDLFTK